MRQGDRCSFELGNVQHSHALFGSPYRHHARSASQVLNQVRHIDVTGARDISGDDWNVIEQSAERKMQYAEALYESMRVLPSAAYQAKQWQNLIGKGYTQLELEANAVYLVDKAIEYHRSGVRITFDKKRYVPETGTESQWTC
ncbi:hypothetical protein M8818_007748 [Zalaria obscura]|uniref:Uncharacterized protein n=1 Tax=Zalaria obscura TaxID=2024903 RepID=A0ACC3S681_9PEZI